MLIDQLSVATIFYLANLVAPAIIIYLILDTGLLSADSVENFPLITYYYNQIQSIDKWIVFIGSVTAYLGLVFGYKLFELKEDSPRPAEKEVTSRLRFTWVVIGFMFVFLMLVFGNSLVPGSPIKGLLLSVYFRADDPFYGFERNALNANIYAFTNTFLLVSILGYSLSDKKTRGRLLYLILTLFFLLVDIIASGARRNLLIAAIIAYMYVANRSGKYKIYYMVPVAIVAVPLLYFGKSILRGLSDFDVGSVFNSDVTFLQQALVAACDTGISHVESLGTLALYHDIPRFGIDHVFSVLRMIPFGTFGFDKPFPMRIVRISTAYLTGDPTTQDVPPGYLGQCWIDFPFLGFFIMPLLHGAVFALVGRIFKSVDLPRSPFYLMIFLALGYVAALPFNSGTLDFICSPDIVLAVLLFFLLHYTNTKSPGMGGFDGVQLRGNR